VVEENVGLVWNIVKRFRGRGYDPEDLFQIGCIGLIKSIDHFDLEYGVKFSTYAVPVILGEIKRFLRDDGLIKVSRTMKENGWKIQRVTQRLNQELGRQATVDEIAAATELEPEEIALAMEANREVESIYRPICQPQGKEICLIDQVLQGENGGVGYVSRISALMGKKGEMDSGVDREKERVLNKVLLEQLLKKLEVKERRLIELRYFQDMTQTEVAKELGVSQVQVSRLEKKILARLRKMAV
jgi:RNA polymerase sporulation-specific sigma factor